MLFSALLHVAPDELLGVLLKDLVYFVQEVLGSLRPSSGLLGIDLRRHRGYSLAGALRPGSLGLLYSLLCHGYTCTFRW